VKSLILYYGVLQTLHLLVLLRAGVILFTTDSFPFPILPPPAGWEDQAIYLMLGLGFTDTISILLGMHFAYRASFKHQLNRRMGVISLTAFITGAIVFGFGTFPSGAWAAHPFAYGIMVVLFLPSIWLYIWLLKSNLKPGKKQPVI